MVANLQEGDPQVRGCDPYKLLLGDEQTDVRPLGFGGPNADRPRPKGIIQYDGDAHLITVAPTRSGKGVGTVIPNLLNYAGPAVCFDPKGEAYMVTARRRRDFGPVYKLDPFGVIDDDSDGLNPLDIFNLPRAILEDDAQAMAELLARGNRGVKDPFWDVSGSAINSAMLAYVGALDDARRHLPHMIEMLTTDDVIYNLAKLLDESGKTMSRMAYRDIAALLQMPDVTRGGVLATAQSHIKSLLSPRVAKSLEKSTFSLKDVMDGVPMSIYVIIPPDKLQSHRALLKLQIGTLLSAVLRRSHRPPQRTLFILDELAQLEHFPLLESLLTLCAGYGVWAWLIVQDLAQLQTHYPTSWKTILNNCGVVQTFGIYNRDMATQWSGYLDHGPAQLRSLRPEEQVVARHGLPELRCGRLNYLTDSRFEGLFDTNRFYTTPGKLPKRPR